MSQASTVTGFGLVAILGLYMLLLFLWQLKVLAGRSMQNPDGSSDDWKQQKTHYGIAIADVFLACPAAGLGIAMVFLIPMWGYFTLSLIAFWLVWSNTMTTATSLKFESPAITLQWIIVFPSGIVVGAGYLAWFVLHATLLFSGQMPA